MRSTRRRVVPIWLVPLVIVLPVLVPAMAWAQNVLQPLPSGLDRATGIDQLTEGWSQFGDGWLLLDMVVVLLLAMVLGGIIAYHPSTRRRASTRERYEQPKTFLMYAMVAAVVALIVQVEPAMAFVIFGIGGLLRFRTLVGEAKDTGRVILVTVVGLCCGLKIFIVAVPATLLGWSIIYFLEREQLGTIRVSGVPEEYLRESTVAYRKIIDTSGFEIIGEQTKFIKREFEFVVKSSPIHDRRALDQRLDEIDSHLRGKVDWEGL